MTGYPWTAWLWWIGGAALGLLGLWLLYWSLLHDRSKGRRRCPKCWYDMSGTDSMTCSECGRTTKREKNLYKTHRRWRWAFAALVVFMFLGAIALTPKVRKDGWTSIVPTTALIVGLPWYEDWSDSPAGWKKDAFNELYLERLYDSDYEPRDIPDWQWRLLLRICLAQIDAATVDPLEDGPTSNYEDFVASALYDGTMAKVGMMHHFFERFPLEIKWSLETPWPAGAPVRSFIELNPSFGPDFGYEIELDSARATSDSATIVLNPEFYRQLEVDGWPWIVHIAEQLPEGAYSLELRLKITPAIVGITPRLFDHGFHVATLTEELVIRGSVGEYLRPISDPQLTEQLVSSIKELQFDFDFDPQGLPPSLSIEFSPNLRDVYEEMIVVLTLDVLHQGEIVATTHKRVEELDPAPQTGSRSYDVFFVLDCDSQALEKADLADNLWELRFRADPLHVLWWESSGDYWAGEFTIPIDWNDPLQHKSMANYH